MKRVVPLIVGGILMLAVLVAVIVIPIMFKAAAPTPTPYVAPTATQEQSVTLNGFCGSEKIPFFSDPAVIAALAKYQLTVNCKAMGSIAMVTQVSTDELKAQKTDFLSPSNSAAVAIFESKHNKGDFPGYQAADVFYSPLVLLTVKEARDAEIKVNAIQLRGGFYYFADMPALVNQVVNKVTWQSLDPAQSALTGYVKVGSTNPGSSNSGNLFYFLLGNIVAGDPTQGFTSADQAKVLPALHQIRVNVGDKASTSEDLFNEWIQGAKEYTFPMANVYESQILEYSNEQPADFKSRINSEFSVVYPEPDINSVHEIICLDSECARLITALKSPDLQPLEWRHGFRTTANNDPSVFPNFKIPHLTQFTNLPEPSVYLAAVACLQDSGPCQ
ncbi:MAG: hypothetical protein WA821_19750 [Anaerolineales bacterium]